MNRKLTALLGGAAVVATAGLSAAAPAMAATSHPAATAAHKAPSRFNPGDSIGIAPALNPGGFFMTAEGVGVQIQTTTSGTNWDTSAATIGYKIMPGSNHSHCLQEVGDAVEIENCAAGNEKQWWTFTGGGIGGGASTIVNVMTEDYMGVFNAFQSRPVYAEGQHTGYDTGWDLTSGGN